MARPRPVPPYLRVVELSTWVKGWNSRSMRDGRNADPGVAHAQHQRRTPRRSVRRRVSIQG